MKKLTETQITELKEKFSAMTDRDSLLDLLNWILATQKQEEINVKDFINFINPKFSGDKRYHSFSIKKKSGGERIINAPSAVLGHILNAIYILIGVLAEEKIHPKAMGFVQGKSVVDNAKLHLEKNYVYNIDLQDFFHSFDIFQVKNIFMKEPFFLSEEKEPLAFLLASACTHPLEINGKTKAVLPQGSPTSPILTNIICKKMDFQLDKLAKKYKAVYSRYADDISFSSNKSIFKNPDFLKELDTIITKNGLTINPKKTRLQKKTQRQEVTGLTVNEKVNTSRRYVKQIRSWLYLIETYGIEKAETIFRKDYIREKGHIKIHNNPMLRVIYGKLLYLRMVKGAEDSTYLKLAQRLDKICGFDTDKILKVWEEKGATEAEKLFRKQLINKFINIQGFYKDVDGKLDEFFVSTENIF